MQEKLWRVEQFAAFLSLHRSTIRRWIREGKLPGAKRIMRRWYIPESEVKAFWERAPGPKSPETKAIEAMLDEMYPGRKAAMEVLTAEIESKQRAMMKRESEAIPPGVPEKVPSARDKGKR